MTNYNERLYEILERYRLFANMAYSEVEDGFLTADEFKDAALPKVLDEAKQAILRLAVQALKDIKEQLPTSEQLTTKYGYHMPEKMYGYKLGLHDAREAIDQFEQNLLKELEEV